MQGRLLCAIATMVATMMAGVGWAQTNPPANKEFEKMSAGFWTDWKSYSAGDDYKALMQAAGTTERTQAAVVAAKKEGRQAIVDVAVAKPAEVAKLMADGVGASKAPTQKAALATVLNMRTTDQTRQAAQAMVPQQQQAQVQQFRANLSTGMPGLPGIYLGSSPQARAPVPVGYAPVRGGSMGCRTR